MTVIGIDPGVTGAAVRLRSGEKRPEIVDLPTKNRHTGRPRIDGDALLTILEKWTERNRLTFIGTEAIHAMPVSGSVGVFSQGSVTGSIEAVIDILQAKRPYVQAKHVSPHAWKKHFGLLKKTKEHARIKALAVFGDLPDLRRKKDHNRAEAMLIALYVYHQIADGLDGVVGGR